MSTTKPPQNMPGPTAAQAPDPLRVQIQETPLAFFSTEGGRYPARKVDHANPPPTLVRTNERADMEKMAREMRQKWPHQCYGIFARSSQGHLQWHLPWFFDEYDAVLHGARFLYEMVLMMQKQNEAAATKYIDDWGASNESKWYEIDLDHLTWERAFADFDKVTFGEEFLKICFRQMKAKWDGPKEVMQRQENVEFLKHRMAPQYPPEAFNTQLNAAIPAFNPQPNFGIPFVPHLAHGPNQQQRAAFVTVNGGPYLQSYDGHVAVHDTQHLERHPQRGGRGNRGKPRGGRRPSASEHDQSDDYPGGSSFAPARRESFGRRQSVSDVPPPSQTLARKRTGSLARSHPAMDAGETSRWRPEDLEVGFNQVGKGINYLKVLNLGLISPNTTQKDMCEALEGVGLRVNWVAIHAPKDDNSGDPFGSAELHSTDDVKRGLRMKTIRCNDVDLILSISKRFQRSGREGPDYEVPEHKPPASAYYPRSYSPQDVRSSQETAQQSRRGSFTSQDVLRPNSPMKHTQRGRLGGNAAPGLEAIAEEAGQGRKHAVDDQTKSNRTGKIPRSELAVHEEKENLDQTKIEAAKDASQKSEALATVPPTMEESVQTAPNEPSEVRLAERIRSTEKISKDLDTIHNEQPSASSKNPMKLSVNLGHSEVAAQNSQGLTSGAPQVADLSALGITTPSSRSAGKSTTTSAPLKSDIKEVPVVKRRDHEKTGSRESVGKDSAVSARSDHSAGVSGNPSEQASPSKSTTISKQKKSEGTPTKLTAVQSKQKIAEWQIVTPKKGVQASPQATMPPVVLSPTAEAAARTAPQETPSAAFAPAEPMENAETSGTSQPRIAITPADSPPTTPVTVSQPDLPSLSPWKEDCDKISKVLATLMEKQQRDSAFSLQNIRSGFEKIDQEFEVGLAKYYGGSKTMKKSSRQKLNKLCDRQKDMLEDLRLLDLQVGQMIGTSLTLDELAGKRQEEKPKPKPKPEPKPASSYPKLDHKHARLDSEGSSASNTQSPQPSIAAAMQQPKASQWPFLNMYTGKAADMVSLLRAPSQSYAVDEHGIDSQISYSPLAQMVFQGKEEWERKQAASSGSLAKLKRDVEKMNDEELKTKAETAAAQAADAQVFERELRRIEQQHEAASASDEISSPTAVGSNTTIEDVQSNNGNETQTGTGTGKGKQSASQPQPQDEQRPSMRGGSIEAAQGPRPSYASAARSSSRPVIPALPKGVAKRAGEDKKASASGEWRVREGEDWSRSGGFKKGG